MNTILRSLKQDLLYPKHFVMGRKKSSTSIEAIPLGQGAVVDENGQKVAVYKDQSGTVTKHSAVCTHMGCIVGWDDSEHLWQCPCHGSQYNKDGKVVHGPAKRDLPKVM